MKIFDPTRHKSGKDYVDYQIRVTEHHLLPFLKRQGVSLDGPVMDIGCSTGGCAIALGRLLDAPITGVDICPTYIEIARQQAMAAGIDATFHILDILRDDLPGGPFKLLLMRDVVEHLADLPEALRRLRTIVAQDGFLYITFPPWRGPYAAHQHNAWSRARFMPYFHLIAPNLFLRLLHRWEAEREDWLADQRQIFKNRLTRRKFEAAVREAGWIVHFRRTYFLRPAFMRMGLPIVSNGLIGRIPILGESLTTACEYLLARGDGPAALVGNDGLRDSQAK